MTWENEIFQVFPVGAEMTVPDIAGSISGLHPNYPASTVRSKIYNVLNKNTYYGIIEKLGINENGSRLWRRLK